MITYDSTGTGVCVTFRFGEAFTHPVEGATTTVPGVVFVPLTADPATGRSRQFDVTDLGISTKAQDPPRGAPR